MLHMTQEKDRFYYVINFPSEKIKKRFKMQLLAYRAKSDPDKPIYQVLAELMQNALYDKLERNSIGVKHEDFKRIVDEKFEELGY